MDLESRVERLEKENQQLKKENQVFKDEIRQLKEENQQLKEKNQKLREENQRLRAELYGFKPSKKKKKSKKGTSGRSKKSRKQGAPKGHRGSSRRKPASVDETIPLKADYCPDCGGEVSPIKESSPRERYMEELVPARLYVTRYILHQGYCSACKKTVAPEVPEAIGNQRFGIRFLLYITYLRFVLNLPYNKIARMLNDLFEAGVSEGTLVDYVRRAGERLGKEYERIKTDLRHSANCHYDDTGQRIEGENRWLWVFINHEAVLYQTSKTRSRRMVEGVLGRGYSGVTVQDFYPSYDSAPGLKQKCWSHLLKDARELADKKHPPPGAERLYRRLRRLYHEAVEVEEKLGTNEDRKADYRSFVERLKKLAGRDYGHCDTNRLARRAMKYRQELFTFMLYPEVEPTNNLAERALRPPVRQRKISGCHRTFEGAYYRDVIMSVMGTLKLQGKDFFEEGRELLMNQELEKGE